MCVRVLIKSFKWAKLQPKSVYLTLNLSVKDLLRRHVLDNNADQQVEMGMLLLNTKSTQIGTEAGIVPITTKECKFQVPGMVHISGKGCKTLLIIVPTKPSLQPTSCPNLITMTK